jgi:hypothetical protein
VSIKAELGSIASTLDQLVERIDGLAAGVAPGADEDIAIALLDVERSLRTGSRRLERLLRDLA